MYISIEARVCVLVTFFSPHDQDRMKVWIEIVGARILLNIDIKPKIDRKICINDCERFAIFMRTF